MDRLGGEHKRGAVLHWLTHFGRGVGRVVIAVLAFILGLLPDVHAIGPSRSCADDVVVPAFIDVVGPSSHVFLAAYRANGPPNSIVILISAATAVEDRSGSSRRYFIAFVCKSGRSARLEDGLYGAYYVPNGTDPEGKFWWMIGGALIGAGLDAIDQWANIAMGSQQGWDWSRTFMNAGIGALAGGLFKYGGMWGKALVTSFGGVATALGGIETYNRWQTYGPNDPRTLVSAAQTMLGLAGTYYGVMYPRVNYSLTMPKRSSCPVNKQGQVDLDPYYSQRPDGSATYISGRVNDHGIIANLSEKGVLDFEVKANPLIGRGKDLFSDMINAFGVEKIKVIQGNWLYGSNLTAYTENIAAGFPPAQAAAMTWTGEMAGRWGFKRVKVVQDGQGNVVVEFTR